MKIGMLLDKEFFGDLRVENEVQALSEAGFDVFVFCFSFSGKRGTDSHYGAKIIHIPVSKTLINKLRGLNNTIFNFYPYYLSKLIINYLRKYHISVLHIHDLYLFEVGLIIKKSIRNIKLIGDLHENYVEGLKHYKFANTFPGKYIISIKRWEKSEINWCKSYDYLITVIEEAVERYASLGINREKMFVVSNYVNLSTFNINQQNNEINSKLKKFKTLTYVGGFDTHRGLEIAIKAVPRIVDKIQNFKLVLVGSGKNLQDLKILSSSLGIDDFVLFEGWQPHSILSSYILASDICLIPHLKTEHTDNTIPHKLFQYMLLKKPIIASNCNPIERILLETNAGVVYKSKDENDLAEKTIKLFSNDDMLRFGENGYEAIMKKYNWDETKKTLIDLYLKINSNKTANG